MRVIAQRVLKAKCVVEGQVTGSIERGLVVFVGFTHTDTLETVKAMVHKLSHARLFEDDHGKLNLDILETKLSILSISQFTVYGETRKGHRPSFTEAASADLARALYAQFNEELRHFCPVETGQFQAHMEITLTHDGPVTLMYEL